MQRRDWRDWWQNDDVRYLQFLGKDNVPFHTVSFPATLIGSGEPWKTVDVVKGFHWLTYQGGKFSTSRGRGIFADAALAELPADLWRWWLIANAPETADTDFSISRFAADTNKDLADVFGNLVNRAFRFTERTFAGARAGVRRARRTRAGAGGRDRGARGAPARTPRGARISPRRRGDTRDLGPRQRVSAGRRALDRASRQTRRAPRPRPARRSTSSASRRSWRGASSRTSPAACWRRSANTPRSRAGRSMSRRTFCQRPYRPNRIDRSPGRQDRRRSRRTTGSPVRRN